MKKIAQVLHAHGGHWVGDGFPVRTLFSYDGDAQALSPFLLFDYAGPHVFPPAMRPRGVGQHPHRGFETVTIVYDGEVSHRDSTGAGGTIGPGDVQWMTAAGGIIHEEFHSPAFTKTGGPFRVVQLWVNLPVKDKLTKPGYQSITNADIPLVALPNEAGRARIIAGDFAGTKGPAKSFSPVNVWDLRLNRDAEITLDLPEGHTAMVAVLTGHLTVNGKDHVGEAEIVRFEREGSKVTLRANSDTMLLVLTGEPLGEPVFGYGPFVMTNEAEIRQAIDDFNSGRFGQVANA
ncbi:MAG TPA: pirin family protein [Rhizomicrobium sp.]|nr:pirin family protein [Rhizomicrobium sp.]